MSNVPCPRCGQRGHLAADLSKCDSAPPRQAPPSSNNESRGAKLAPSAALLPRKASTARPARRDDNRQPKTARPDTALRDLFDDSYLPSGKEQLQRCRERRKECRFEDFPDSLQQRESSQRRAGDAVTAADAEAADNVEADEQVPEEVSVSRLTKRRREEELPEEKHRDLAQIMRSYRHDPQALAQVAGPRAVYAAVLGRGRRCRCIQRSGKPQVAGGRKPRVRPSGDVQRPDGADRQRDRGRVSLCRGHLRCQVPGAAFAHSGGENNR
ncbi:hypothetical protein GQ600_5126 [Phytophthora cactorum]|nr:hypothetical protein GQ600_5126 [Phytophthora cactorum]